MQQGLVGLDRVPVRACRNGAAVVRRLLAINPVPSNGDRCVPVGAEHPAHDADAVEAALWNDGGRYRATLQEGRGVRAGTAFERAVVEQVADAHVIIDIGADLVAPAHEGGDDIDFIFGEIGFKLVEEMRADPAFQTQAQRAHARRGGVAPAIARTHGGTDIHQNAAARLVGEHAIRRTEHRQASTPFGFQANFGGGDGARLCHVDIGGTRRHDLRGEWADDHRRRRGLLLRHLRRGHGLWRSRSGSLSFQLVEPRLQHGDLCRLRAHQIGQILIGGGLIVGSLRQRGRGGDQRQRGTTAAQEGRGHWILAPEARISFQSRRKRWRLTRSRLTRSWGPTRIGRAWPAGRRRARMSVRTGHRLCWASND